MVRSPANTAHSIAVCNASIRDRLEAYPTLHSQRTVPCPMFRDPMSASATSFYKRSNFVTHLPVDCLYSPSHFWLAKMGGARLRIGFTKFATRMLGEIVEVRFEKPPGSALAGGDIVGSIEGFKAISDLYACAVGSFAGGNPALTASVESVGKNPYGEGWLYEVDGEPDDKCVPLDQYRAMLDTTIDKILEKQKAEAE